jgi:3-oxoacyl-[acyl-carrier-protein] synthase III
MTSNPQLRIVLVGRDLSIQPLEDTLMQQGASNYICVPSVEAAEWLIRDGYDADVLIVHQSLFARAADLMELRSRNPQAIVLPTSARCDEAEVKLALASALRRREARDAEAKPGRRGLFAGFGRRLAWG